MLHIPVYLFFFLVINDFQYTHCRTAPLWNTPLTHNMNYHFNFDNFIIL